MTDEERKTLVDEIIRAMCIKRGMPACDCAITGKCRAPIENFQFGALPDQARAALAVAERRIREDCAEIAEKHAGKGLYKNVGVAAAIRASIPQEP